VIVLIALQAFILSQLGLRLGNRLSERLREGAERVAGLALTALGLVLLGEKLLS
jgi:putative Mn2+ efflux pump MntP